MCFIFFTKAWFAIICVHTHCELVATWARPYISHVSYYVLILNGVAVSYLEIKYRNSDSRNAVYLIGLRKNLPFMSVVRTSYFSSSEFQCPWECCLSREENQSFRNSNLVHVAAIVCRSLFIPFFFLVQFLPNFL